jgi:hypothetical protein
VVIAAHRAAGRARLCPSGDGYPPGLGSVEEQVELLVLADCGSAGYQRGAPPLAAATIRLFAGPYLLGNPVTRTGIGVTYWLLVPAVIIAVFGRITRRTKVGHGGVVSRTVDGVIEVIPSLLLLPQVIFLTLAIRHIASGSKPGATTGQAAVRTVFAQSAGHGPKAAAAAQAVSVHVSAGLVILALGVFVLAVGVLFRPQEFWYLSQSKRSVEARESPSPVRRILRIVGDVVRIVPKVLIICGLFAILVYSIAG